MTRRTRADILAQRIREATECFEQGKLSKAKQLYLRALPLAKVDNDFQNTATIYSSLGLMAMTQNKFAQAQRFYYEALPIYESLEDKNGLATTCLYLGKITLTSGDFEESLQLCNRALEAYQALGDKEGIAMTYTVFGDIALRGEKAINQAVLGEISIGKAMNQHSDVDEAERYFSKSLELFREIGDRKGMAHTYANLASVAVFKFDSAMAREMLREAIPLFAETGETIFQLEAQRFLMSLESSKGLEGE